MRVPFLTTVAAAVLALSVPAFAQTGGGISGTTSGGVPGSTSGGASAPALKPSTGSGGATAAPEAGTTTGTTGTSGKASSGTASGTMGTSGSATSTQTRSAPHTTGSTTGSVSVSTEQRTEIGHAFRSVHVEPLDNVSFSVSVGSVVPTTVTTLHTCPSDVVRILNGLPECRYVVVRDKIVIIEPNTHKIVTVIEREG